MGSLVIPAGISIVSDGGGAGRPDTQRVRPGERNASDANASRPVDSQAPESAKPEDGGTYQVADAVVFQLQLLSITSGAGQTGSAAPNAAPGSASPQPATAAPAAEPAAASAAANPNASSGASSVVEDAASSSSVQSQEVQLRNALQALGLSPEVIQEFMAVARLLAQIAPNVFHNFVSQMVYLAKSQSGTTPAVSGNAAATNATPASENNAGPAAIEFASLQLTEAAVQIQSASGQGGNAVTVAAESQTIAIEMLQGAPQAATSSQTPTANTTPAPAAKTATAGA